MKRRDLALDKGLPWSEEAERIVLGVMLGDEESVPLLISLLRPEMFFLERHRRVYSRIQELFRAGQKVSAYSVGVDLQRLDQLEADGVSYLVGMADLPRLPNPEHFASIVHDKWVRRAIIYGSKQLIDRCLMDVESWSEIRADQMKYLEQLGQDMQLDSGFHGHESIAARYGASLFSQPDEGITTPFPALNRAIVGFLPGDLVVLGARPSAGKSAFAQQTGRYAAKRHGTVAFCSLEMKDSRVLMRAIAEGSVSEGLAGGISTNELRSGNLTATQRDRIRATCNELFQLPFQTNTTARTVAAIEQSLRQLHTLNPLKLVIVDHLHEVRTIGRHDRRIDELRYIASEMKRLALELDVPLLLLAQLNRSSEKEKREPAMSDLRDSGDIEQIADIVMFLHSKEETESQASKKPFHDVDLLLTKQRDGVARLRLPMLFFGKYFHFVEATERMESQ